MTKYALVEQMRREMEQAATRLLLEEPPVVAKIPVLTLLCGDIAERYVLELQTELERLTDLINSVPT